MKVPTPEFKVLLYAPGLPAAGVRARARFEGESLVVNGRDGDSLVAADQLSLKTGGFDGRQWLITWVTPQGLVTAMLQGEDAVDAFISLAPASLSANLRRARRHLSRGSWRFRLGMILLAAVLALPLLALGLFWLESDRISGWAAEQISPEREKQLGDLAFEQMKPSLRLMEEGAAHDAVESIGVRLSGGSRRFQFQFHLADDPRVNAFALPGGHVVVFTGLLRFARDDDELAAVLAHEISHIRQRHALRGMIRAMGWRAMLGVALGQYGGGLWGDMARELGDLGYSRELEREADREGLLLLRRSGLPGTGMARFFERMARDEKAPPALLASHPASAERLAAIRADAAELGPYVSHSMGLDWSAVRADLDRRAVR